MNYTSLILLLEDFKGMTLNTIFETCHVLILDIDENPCILSRLWLEDKQPLAHAGSTGSVVGVWQRVAHRMYIYIGVHYILWKRVV